MNNPDQGETRNIFLLNSQAEAGMSVGLGGVARQLADWPASGFLVFFFFLPFLNLWALERSHIQGDALSPMLLVGM